MTRELVFEIDIYGRPAPQGSKNYMGQRGGRGVMVESSKYVKPWRSTVKADALAKRQSIAGWEPLDEALWVEMVFTSVRPRSHYRTGRNAHLLRDTAPPRPISKPDVSKLCRSTEDALTDAGVWRDDCVVADYLRLGKVYAGEDKDALDAPGVRIRIYREVPDHG